MRATPVGALLICASAATTQTARQTPALETPLQHIGRLAASAHMPLGIVLGMDRSLCAAAPVPHPVDETDAKAAVLALAHQYQFTVQGSDPLVLRSTRGGSGRLDEALHHTYATFPSLSGRMLYMGYVVDGWIISYLHPKEGYGMSLGGNGSEEELVIPPMTDVSLETVADHIVTLGHKGLWLAEEGITKTGDVRTRVTAFSYHDDAEALEHVTCQDWAAK